MKTDLEKFIKTLELKPGTILVADRNRIDVTTLQRIEVEGLDFRVPILAVDGIPSIERFTRDELAQALRLIDHEN
jgi:hypothetical protein